MWPINLMSHWTAEMSLYYLQCQMYQAVFYMQYEILGQLTDKYKSIAYRCRTNLKNMYLFYLFATIIANNARIEVLDFYLKKDCLLVLKRKSRLFTNDIQLYHILKSDMKRTRNPCYLIKSPYSTSNYLIIFPVSVKEILRIRPKTIFTL